MKKRMLKKLFNILLAILLIITAYYVYDYVSIQYTKYKIRNNSKEELELMKKSDDKKSLEYYRAYYKNNDIVGRLTIENTNIDTLLVKCLDNEYYLNHSIKKEYDEIGSIYVDYRTNLNSKQVNIYGHNSNVYDVMFKELEKYLDKEYYLNHKYILLWDGDVTNKYEIFSIQIVTNDYEHIDVNTNNWKNHINILSKSIYETGSFVNDEDEILIIQTCLYNPKNSFLIINSKKV